jgi:hypothetical protein
MEGFHLFQGKIKGEVQITSPQELSLRFVPMDTLSGWDTVILYEYDDFNDLGAFAQFRIEYSELEKDIRLHLKDFHHPV